MMSGWFAVRRPQPKHSHRDRSQHLWQNSGFSTITGQIRNFCSEPAKSPQRWICICGPGFSRPAYTSPPLGPCANCSDELLYLGAQVQQRACWEFFGSEVEKGFCDDTLAEAQSSGGASSGPS